jgi:hypothetical protein
MKCPTCKREVTESGDKTRRPPHFPFCTERCQLVDLGRWLGEEYRIPLEPVTENTEDES